MKIDTIMISNIYINNWKQGLHYDKYFNNGPLFVYNYANNKRHDLDIKFYNEYIIDKFKKFENSKIIQSIYLNVDKFIYEFIDDKKGLNYT